MPDAEHYCHQLLANWIPTPKGDLIKNVRKIRDESLLSVQEQDSTSVRDKLVASQQQTSSLVDEQTSVIMLETEHLEDENTPLQDRTTLSEAQNSAKPDHIASIMASPSEIASLKLKPRTIPTIEATMIRHRAPS